MQFIICNVEAHSLASLRSGDNGKVKLHFSRRQRKLSGRIEHYCHTLIGTTASTAANYTVFFIAPAPCYVSSFKEVHQTAGTDAGAVTLQLEKLNSTEALDAGDNVLATALSLKSAIDTVQTATLTTTNANRTLATGDRLAMKDAGTLTAVANVTVLLELTYT